MATPAANIPGLGGLPGVPGVNNTMGLTPLTVPERIVAHISSSVDTIQAVGLLMSDVDIRKTIMQSGVDPFRPDLINTFSGVITFDQLLMNMGSEGKINVNNVTELAKAKSNVPKFLADKGLGQIDVFLDNVGQWIMQHRLTEPDRTKVVSDADLAKWTSVTPPAGQTSGMLKGRLEFNQGIIEAIDSQIVNIQGGAPAAQPVQPGQPAPQQPAQPNPNARQGRVVSQGTIIQPAQSNPGNPAQAQGNQSRSLSPAQFFRKKLLENSGKLAGAAGVLASTYAGFQYGAAVSDFKTALLGAVLGGMVSARCFFNLQKGPNANDGKFAKAMKVAGVAGAAYLGFGVASQFVALPLALAGAAASGLVVARSFFVKPGMKAGGDHPGVLVAKGVGVVGYSYAGWVLGGAIGGVPGAVAGGVLALGFTIKDFFVKNN